jgi:SHS family lactate transporter-like MFS transporter
MISLASAQIEATGGDRLKTTTIKSGKMTIMPDYAHVQGIPVGTVAIYIIFLAIIGPECVPPSMRYPSTAFI